MTPTRLIHSGSLEQQRLLRAAKGDGPSHRLRQQLLMSASLGTVVLTASTASGTPLNSAGQLSSLAAPSIASSAVASTSIAVLVKWIGIAGVALFVGLGAGFAAGTTLANQRAPLAKGAVPAAFADNAAVAAIPLSESERVNVAAAQLQVESPTLPVAGRIRNLHAKASSTHTVAGEVQLVDAARTALRAGDATQCLHWLAERRRRFPQGLLGPEAALIRIEALTQSGQMEAARDSGRQFLEEYPTGPLAHRVRSLLGLHSAPKVESGTALL